MTLCVSLTSASGPYSHVPRSFTRKSHCSTLGAGHGNRASRLCCVFDAAFNISARKTKVSFCYLISLLGLLGVSGLTTSMPYFQISGPGNQADKQVKQDRCLAIWGLSTPQQHNGNAQKAVLNEPASRVWRLIKQEVCLFTLRAPCYNAALSTLQPQTEIRTFPQQQQQQQQNKIMPRVMKNKCKKQDLEQNHSIHILPQVSGWEQFVTLIKKNKKTHIQDTQLKTRKLKLNAPYSRWLFAVAC